MSILADVGAFHSQSDRMDCQCINIRSGTHLRPVDEGGWVGEHRDLPVGFGRIVALENELLHVFEIPV